jgi:hypothetical protein
VTSKENTTVKVQILLNNMGRHKGYKIIACIAGAYMPIQRSVGFVVPRLEGNEKVFDHYPFYVEHHHK